MYQLLRRLLFLLPAETAHYFSMNLLQAACAAPAIRSALRRQFLVQDRRLEKKLWNLSFRNGVGLGAGFDKNARYLRELEVLGFGFVEIGTVTPRPQAGNPQPRLFRLPEDKALINRMGFNNEGVAAVAGRLAQWRQQQHAASKKQAAMLVGGNIGKNKDTPNEEAWKDYLTCFQALHDHVDFFVVNVSSPNTPGLRALQDKEALRTILQTLQDENKRRAVQRPILLKIAPDLTREQIDDVIALATEINLDGLVAANTSIAREGLHTSAQTLEAIGAGGLSGAPVKNRATEVVRYVADRTGGRLPIIGSGGISSPADAEEKLAVGAQLIEVWTGFIYEGPSIVRRICRHWASKAGNDR